MGTKRNTAYNLGGAVVPVVLLLATVPLYLELVGEARYGVLALVWLFTGYFAFFDFGLGRATAYAIAKASDLAENAACAASFWTALAINIALGALGALIVLLAAPIIFVQLIDVSPALADELLPVLPWLALAVPLLTLEGVFAGALTGKSRFLALNVRFVIGTVITQLVPLACVWLIAPTLTVAIPATIVARTISVAILAGLAFRAVGAGIKPKFGGKRMARDLLGYGGWVSIGGILNPLISNFDRFLIGAVLGPVAVAFYAIPFQLVSRGSVFANALAPALFPRLAAQDPEAAKALALRGVRANAALMCVLCTVGIIIMQPFLTLWIDAEFARRSAIIGQLLAISVWANALALIALNFLQAQGRPKETTLILLVQAAPYLAIAGAGISLLGLVGVALARNFRSLLDAGLLAYRSGLLRPVVQLAIVPLGIFATLIAITNLAYFATPISLFASLAGFAAALLYAQIIFPEGRVMLAQAYQKLRRSES